MTKEQTAAYMKDWYKKNKERQAEYAKQYYQKTKDANLEANRQRAREWLAKNRERANSHKREKYHATKILIGRPKQACHHLWKGEAVGYDALHRWVVREKGQPNICEHCFSEKKKKYEWANIDHTYKRNLADYIRLCTSCHRKYDMQNNNYQPKF